MNEGPEPLAQSPSPSATPRTLTVCSSQLSLCGPVKCRAQAWPRVSRQYSLPSLSSSSLLLRFWTWSQTERGSDPSSTAH